MNGQNGHHNGNGNDSFSQAATSTWTVGLLNSALKYLTAETFGFKVIYTHYTSHNNPILASLQLLAPECVKKNLSCVFLWTIQNWGRKINPISYQSISWSANWKSRNNRSSYSPSVNAE